MYKRADLFVVPVHVPRDYLTSLFEDRSSRQTQGIQQRTQYFLPTTSQGNPGFCPQAWLWLRSTKSLDSDFPNDSYTCLKCGQDGIFSVPWEQYTYGYSTFRSNPLMSSRPIYSLPFISKKFMAASHVPAQRDCKERQSCLICWEKQPSKWVEPMDYTTWWKHINEHFKGKDPYLPCLVSKGVMIPRAQCPKDICPKVHS